MPALPPDTDFNNAANQGAAKAFITSLRAYLAGLLGTIGTAADARTALGAASSGHDHAGVYEPVQTAVSQAEAEAGTSAALRSWTPQRVAQAITALTPSAGSFPAGTAMLFAQTSAPTGWTKSTTHNDKALRVVSGAAGSGGSVAFSTVFGRTAVDGFTLTTNEMPSHNHALTFSESGGMPDAPVLPGQGVSTTPINTSNAGGGASHAHNIDLRVNYVDVIIATKD